MRRSIVAGAGLSMMAGLAAAAALGGETIPISRPIAKKQPRRSRRQADRSKKQYLLKGIRP